jgi:hypothetical protein
MSLKWKILSKRLSVGMSSKVTRGNRFARKVFKLSGKLSEIANRWMKREMLLMRDSRKFKSAYSKKLNVKLMKVVASKN